MQSPRTDVRRIVAVTLIAMGIVACGGGETKSADETAQATPSASPSVAAGPQTPDPGGKVITIDMLTDDQGNNIFRPAEFQARRGDVIRYTLVSGVHNVNFVADSNPGKAGLPPAGALLQLPGQTHDVKVTWDPGKYYFHCDPHALLGMKGWVTVESGT
jgi:plastocyanin